MKIPIGISACVFGEKVRFDGGHKLSRFIVDELAKYLTFKPVCPEVGIGMQVPRPAIRLLQLPSEEVRLVDSKNQDVDYTDKMIAFAKQKASQFDDLCGYVVCAKSPTCGMERVKLHIPNNNTIPGGSVGIYTRELMAKMPWLPVEEDGRLNDPVLRENFVFRVFSLNDFYHSVRDQLSANAIVKFHSRYKLVLMAHNPIAYKELGSMVAHISEWDINEFYLEYRLQFMNAIKERASRKNKTNVLMHLQGYFKRSLTKEQKQELSELIMSYKEGHQPILVPLALIKHYLREYPDPYLQLQTFIDPYPEDLKLRYGL